MGKFRDLWDRSKDGRDAEKRSFARYAIFATLLFLVLVGFVNQNNIVRWVKAERDIRRLDRQVKEYNAKIDDMDRQIRNLNSDKDSLEQFARENFGFAEPGDDVFLVEK